MIDILQLEGVQPIDYRNEDGCIVITVQSSGEHLETCPECGGCPVQTLSVPLTPQINLKI